MSALASVEARPLAPVLDLVAPGFVVPERQLPDLWVPTGKRALVLYALCHPGAGTLHYDFREDGELFTWGWRDGEMSVLVPHTGTAYRAIRRARSNARALPELVAVVATALESPETWAPKRAAERLVPGRIGGGHLGPLKDWVALLQQGLFQWAGDKTVGALLTEDHRPTDLLLRLNDYPKGGKPAHEKQPVRSGILVPGDSLQIREAPNQWGRRVTAAEHACLRLAAALHVRWRTNEVGKKPERDTVRRVRLRELVQDWAGLQWDRRPPSTWLLGVEECLREERAGGGYGLEAIERHPDTGRSMLTLGPSWRLRAPR